MEGRASVNAFFKFDMECWPKRTKTLETSKIETCQQEKATFQLSSCSKWCPFARTHARSLSCHWLITFTTLI